MSKLERLWDQAQYLVEIDPPRSVALLMVALGFTCFCIGIPLGFWLPLLVLVFNYSLGAGILLILSEYHNPSQMGWKFMGITLVQMFFNIYGLYQATQLLHMGVLKLY